MPHLFVVFMINKYSLILVSYKADTKKLDKLVQIYLKYPIIEENF